MIVMPPTAHQDLADHLFDGPLPPDLRQALAAGDIAGTVGHLRPVPATALACLACRLRDHLHQPVLLVTETMRRTDEMHRNVLAFSKNRESTVLYYPALEGLPGSGLNPSFDVIGDRLHTLHRLNADTLPVIVVTCLQAILQLTLNKATLENASLSLTVGAEQDPEALRRRLEESGYEFTAEVQDKGQASWHGGLLDIWPAQQAEPYRIEFFGSTVETIRTFDPANQRSLARLDQALLPPAHETRPHSTATTQLTPFFTHLPPHTRILWSEMTAPDEAGAAAEGTGLRALAEEYAARIREEGGDASIITLDQTFDLIQGRPDLGQIYSGWDVQWPGLSSLIDSGLTTLANLDVPRLNPLEPELFAEQRRQWLDRLEDRTHTGLRIHLFFNTEGSRDRFRETHPKTAFELHVGQLSDGFLHTDLQLAVISESALTGRQKMLRGRYEAKTRQRTERRESAGETITDWTSIEPGDRVVHVEHGIGRYLGLYEIEFNGQRQEALALEYADKAKLYVPVSQTHLLSRYIGVGKHQAALHRLGGTRWNREKDAAERAVRDLAGTLLDVHASREALEGFVYPPDTPWQHEFEDAFPYEETEDQAKAIADVKRDMESGRPMDRLVCGDVGYGKTEVAMRAAFKTVMSGKQVALLVPTTVLAQQHYEGFVERMAAYPIRIELLCRFRSISEQDEVVRALKEGTVDIVIGTHRIVSADVQFKDLGLVMIDEEQRFGVVHKERLKQLKRLVDVLTLTATPIPRTLYMSLMGAKEISLIQTPPKARQAIETLVVPNDDRIVKDAIQRELNRGGQVYYLYNRVMTIDVVRERLRRLLPRARVAVGHGQMSGHELARVMREFERGDHDVLLCTTIIESGVDIPNVNTILIDRADRFGMSDLYQLRGRVGRSSRKAYAYMLLPVHGHVMDTSRKRIAAIMEHTHLGAGFRLAMRDLEIRGAGNLLGSQQSGHIAAVGFDLYCQLLKRAVAQLRHFQKTGLPPPASALPALVDVEVTLDFIDLSANAEDVSRSAFLAYVEDERQRVSVYRKIASATSEPEVAALRDEFKDRFGPIPGPLDRLLTIKLLRILAAGQNIQSIEAREGRIMFKRQADYLQINNQFPRLKHASPDRQLKELISWVRKVTPKGWGE